MMTCDGFRTQFVPASEDAAQLEHIRSCDACLNFALERDGDVLFRVLGGSELVPPGGVDAFVSDVMREVRLRGKETSVSAHSTSWPRRLAVAATLAATITGVGYMYEHNRAPIPMAPVQHHAFAAPSAPRPVVESYDSERATIVEVPTEGEDVKVVMVFDDSLPADL
jgi:hypothetical protein